MSKQDKFEAKVRIGTLGYDIQRGSTRGTESALFVAPTDCPDGVSRHVTVIFNSETEELYNVHQTNEGNGKRWKQWSRDPNRFISDAMDWLKTRSEPMETPTAKGLGSNYYCVSGWRILVCLQLITGLTSIAERLLFRPLASLGIGRFELKEDKAHNKLSAVGNIDMTRMVEILRKFRPFKGIVNAFLPGMVLKIMPKLAKLFLLISVERMSPGDASLLIPKREGIEPLVLLRGDQYRQLRAATVFEKAVALYEEMELGELLPDPQRLMLSGLSVPVLFEVVGTGLKP